MKLIKNLSIGVAALLATVLIPFTTTAQSYSPAIIALPSVVVGTTNLATPIAIYVGKQDRVRFSFTASSADASSTTNETIKGCWAVNNTSTNFWQNGDTNNAVTLTACVNGKTPLVTATNTLSSAGAGYFIIYQISGGANSFVTNGPAFFGTKLSAP